MKTLITIITLLATLSMAHDTINSMAFGLDLTQDITIKDLWNNLDKDNPIPDTVFLYAETNMIYRKNNLTCYLLIEILYMIALEEGEYGPLKIGMSKRSIFRKLGKTPQQTFPSGKILLEYSYNENVNYTLTLELKNNKLKRITISKKI